MKHLLNNLTDEEKNSIREQHEGGMKVINENFHKMVNKKLGHVNLYEQELRHGGEGYSFPVAPKWLNNVLEMDDRQYRMSLMHKSNEGLHELLKKLGCNDYRTCIDDIKEYRHKFKKALDTVTTVDEPKGVETAEEKGLERLNELQRLLSRGLRNPLQTPKQKPSTVRRPKVV